MTSYLHSNFQHPAVLKLDIGVIWCQAPALHSPLLKGKVKVTTPLEKPAQPHSCSSLSVCREFGLLA